MTSSALSLPFPLSFFLVYSNLDYSLVISLYNVVRPAKAVCYFFVVCLYQQYYSLRNGIRILMNKWKISQFWGNMGWGFFQLFIQFYVVSCNICIDIVSFFTFIWFSLSRWVNFRIDISLIILFIIPILFLNEEVRKSLFNFDLLFENSRKRWLLHNSWFWFKFCQWKSVIVIL